ncbi:MAG: HemK2/MTQ2 family protein methyltransferase [Candidatus Thorarchaeota archaeon]
MKGERSDFVIYNDVYPPSEDTYLLLDSIDYGVDDSILEVGCGSGFATIELCKSVQKMITVDISLSAVRNTKENIKNNGLLHACEIIQSDLLSAIDSETKFSIILFNPPYLPKDDDETSIDHALIGGEEGIETTVRFVPQAVGHLTKEGAIYLVASSLANVGKIEDSLRQQGLSVTVVSKKSRFFERLYILKGNF